MKKGDFMKKKKILFGIVTIVLTIVISVSTSYAATTLFASNEVSYDPGTKEITSTDVQGAIDELYTHANHYKNLRSGVSDVSSYFSNISYSYAAPSDVSVATATNTSIATLSLSSGKYIVMGSATFGANTTGERRISLTSSSDSLTLQDSSGGASGSPVYLSTKRILDLTGTTTVTLSAYHTRGSALSVKGSILAIRLK